ncbi:MAG: DUF448 domain-containing protein [Sphingomonadaceae bacterium]|nr:DUF448 domain-containing protein [Sphingomonadaceae bacterium]
MRTLPNESLSEDHRATGPERKCILSGENAAREALIRLAISPDGDVLPDVHARAPGRGAWIGVSRNDFDKAFANGTLKGALTRSFGKSLGGTALVFPDDLSGRIEAALLRAFTDRLGLELRAGNLAMGSDRIAENARSGRVFWLGHASDASEDGSRKLDQALRVGTGEEGSGRKGVSLPLDRAALSVALGRDNVVHLALIDAAAAERVAAQLERLLHFQGRAEATGKNIIRQTGDGAAPLALTTI